MSENIEHNELVEGEIVTGQEPRPGQLVTLKNGAIYDRSKGRIIGNPPGGPTTAITQSNTDAMHAKRRAATTNAVLRGIEDGTQAPNWRGGVQTMAAALAKLAIKGNEHSPKAFNALLRAADLLPEPKNGGSGGSGLSISVNFSPESALQLVQLLDKMRT